MLLLHRCITGWEASEVVNKMRWDSRLHESIGRMLIGTCMTSALEIAMLQTRRTDCLQSCL
jgi:hypothetical protein